MGSAYGRRVQPTAGLCWAACRRSPAPSDVRAAIDDGADLEFAADLAVAQRFSPLLWRALLAAEVDTHDHKWADVLRDDAARCQAQARLLMPRLGSLVFEPLRSKGLEPLVIKGAALAERYPDKALRPMDDIDIIVHDAETERAADTLVEAGWRRIEKPHDVDEIHLTHPAIPGLPIDLHRALEHDYDRTNRLTSNQLWNQRVPATLHGAAAFSLPVELELVMLAAHAAKPFHSFGRLMWAVDVAMVVTHEEGSGGGIDWDEVARLADSARCRTAVAVRAHPGRATRGIVAVRASPAPAQQSSARCAPTGDLVRLAHNTNRQRDALVVALRARR